MAQKGKSPSWEQQIIRKIEQYAGMATPSGMAAKSVSSRVADALSGKSSPKPYKKAQPKSGRK